MSDDSMPPLNMGDAPDGLTLDPGPFTGTTDPDGDFCVICGTQLVYSGRGPHPKYCDQHKRNQSTNPRGPRVSKDMAGIEQSIASTYTMLGMGVSVFDEMAGMEIATHAPDLARSWVVAAESNPKLRKTLQRMTVGGGMAGVILAHVMVAIPIAKHHGLFDKLMPQQR